MKNGWAWIEGGKIPFAEFREIRRGTHKGMFEIKIPPRTIRVDRKSITRFPVEDNETMKMFNGKGDRNG